MLSETILSGHMREAEPNSKNKGEICLKTNGGKTLIWTPCGQFLEQRNEKNLEEFLINQTVDSGRFSSSTRSSLPQRQRPLWVSTWGSLTWAEVEHHKSSFLLFSLGDFQNFLLSGWDKTLRRTLPDVLPLGKTPPSSQDRLCQCHHVVDAARHVHHPTWHGHLRITDETIPADPG